MPRMINVRKKTDLVMPTLAPLARLGLILTLASLTVLALPALASAQESGPPYSFPVAPSKRTAPSTAATKDRKAIFPPTAQGRPKAVSSGATREDSKRKLVQKDARRARRR